MSLLITVPLSWLMERIYCGDCVEIPSELVTVFKQADPTEAVCHIETIFLPNGRPLKHQLWYKNLWDISYERYLQRQAKSKESNRLWDIQQRNICKLSRKIQEMTELPTEQSEAMARRIVCFKPQSAAAFDFVLEKA